MPALTNVQHRLLDQLRSDANINVYTAPSTRINYIGLNAGVEPNLADPKVRQAISYAIPYQALTASELDSWFMPLSYCCPPAAEELPAHGSKLR